MNARMQACGKIKEMQVHLRRAEDELPGVAPRLVVDGAVGHGPGWLVCDRSIDGLIGLSE